MVPVTRALPWPGRTTGPSARRLSLPLEQNRSFPSLTTKHAQKAKDLATCDGPPDCTYQVAYDETVALLAQLEPYR